MQAQYFGYPVWFQLIAWGGSLFIMTLPFLLRAEQKLQSLNLFGPDPDGPAAYTGEPEDINAE